MTHPRARRRVTRVVVTASLFVGAGCGIEGAGASAEDAAWMTTGGDPARGRTLVSTYGCDACHTIPGVPGADRTVGPPLAGLGARMFIAGLLPNNPDNLVLWIQDPPSIDPQTAMPDVGASEADARDIAAYLYTLP